MPRKMLKAGTLRHLITVQSNSTGKDAYDGVTNTWSTFLTTRASVNPVSGTERYGSDRITADRAYEITCRYDPTKNPISPKHRISWDSRTFDIEAVLEYDERQHIVRLIAVEREV